MAFTINNFCGAETGGIEETVSASGFSASQTYVRSGSYAYASTGSGSFSLFDAVGDAGGQYILSFYFLPAYAPSGGGSGTATFCAVADCFSMVNVGTSSSGDIILRDSTTATIRTISNPFPTGGQWYLVEIVFEHSDSGSIEVFINGVSQGQDTGQDLSAGAGMSNMLLGTLYDRLSGFYFDDIYFASGATSAADRLGNCEVIAYRSSKASVTPDDGGDNLNVGSGSMYWSYMQEVPFSQTNWAGYDGALAGAVTTDDVGGSAGTGGPNTDSNIDGTIAAIKGIWRMDRGNGGGTEHYGLLGNNTDGTTRSVDFDPATSPANYFMVSESASVVPTSTEYCRIGIESTGAQDFQCYDMLAQILHVPPTIGLVYNPMHRMMPFLTR